MSKRIPELVRGRFEDEQRNPITETGIFTITLQRKINQELI